MENQQNTNLNAIERALAAAKARKAARESLDGTSSAETLTAAPTPKAPKPPKDEAAEAARAAAKATRDAERAARKAAREAEKSSKSPSHMKKVNRAREKLPPMDDATQLSFNEVIGSLTALQIATLSQHLEVHNRAEATLRASASRPLPLGASVRITGGDPKHVGLTGTVVHSQKLRAKVEVAGFKNPIYIYTGEAEVVAEEARATG